jgi:hypothetical protein
VSPGPLSAVLAANQGLLRARLEILEPPEDQRIIPLHFNPAEYQLKKAQTFAEIAIPGLSSPPLQWVRGGAETLTFDALVDTSDSGADVDEEYVAGLRGLLDINSKLHAPPIVAFAWARRRFKGVLDGLTVSYLLFDRQGTPLRAKLNITIKEYRPVEIQLREEVKTSADEVKTYLVAAGDTLATIAASVYGDATRWRALARENDIRDPRSLRPGQRLRLPALVS